MTVKTDFPGVAETDIAIVGMAAHLPGAADIGAYWRNLSVGVESIRVLSEAELLAAGESPARLRRPNYVPAAAVLDGFKEFDADFFGFSPKEAAILEQGVPFASLVWMQGHILVYVGQYKNRPVVFHNVWGLHTFGDNGRDGRLVIGRAVATTLRAGEEVPAVGPSHILLNRVKAVSILSRPY